MTPANRPQWRIDADGNRRFASCVLPVVTKSEANERPGHWRVVRGKGRRKKGRATGQREAARLLVSALTARTRMSPPYVVTMVRLAPSNGLDSDNLAGSLKAVRDGIADALGTGDGPGAPVEWIPQQGRAATYGVQIFIAWALSPKGETPP